MKYIKNQHNIYGSFIEFLKFDNLLGCLEFLQVRFLLIFNGFNFVGCHIQTCYGIQCHINIHGDHAKKS
jgi:hypothetical protein